MIIRWNSQRGGKFRQHAYFMKGANGLRHYYVSTPAGAPANVLISQARQTFRHTHTRVFGRVN